jgi:hypothetical protein
MSKCSSKLPTRPFQTELAQYNLEVNVPPQLLHTKAFKASNTTCAKASTALKMQQAQWVPIW